MDMVKNVTAVESNTSFEKEAFNQYVPQPGHGIPKPPEQAGPAIKSAPESLLNETDIKQLIFRALATVIAQDAATPLMERTELLRRIADVVQTRNLREFIAFVQQTIADLRQSQRISAESYELLAAFQKMGRKVRPGQDLQPTDLDPELAELAELINGKSVDNSA
jgi:hypothetical protein